MSSGGVGSSADDGLLRLAMFRPCDAQMTVDRPFPTYRFNLCGFSRSRFQLFGSLHARAAA